MMLSILAILLIVKICMLPQAKLNLKDKDLKSLWNFADYMKENFQCCIGKCIVSIESGILQC